MSLKNYPYINSTKAEQTRWKELTTPTELAIPLRSHEFKTE